MSDSMPEQPENENNENENDTPIENQPLELQSYKDFEIKRWDAVMFGSSNIITPFLTFTPDLKLVEFFENNNNVVQVYILNSNSNYDNIIIPAVISNRCDITGSCMPNYTSRTPFFAANLYSNWLGYPPLNGTVKFIGFTGTL